MIEALAITGWIVVIYTLITVWRRTLSYERRKKLRRQFKIADLAGKVELLEQYRMERRKYGDYDGTYPT